MFDFIKKSRPSDIKGIRNALLIFIKEQLQKVEGGEGKNIHAISLFIFCSPADRYLYERAVYLEEESKFKDDEVQKIADDFAIDLPQHWNFACQFVKEPPIESIKAKNVDAALLLVTNQYQSLEKGVDAYLKVLAGQTETELYPLKPRKGVINIGREKKVVTADGFIRENEIAFVGNGNAVNRSVSRQHGHIQWEDDKNGYYLYADMGGIPPYNKLKVISRHHEPVKLQAIEIGYRLQEGDQIVLGEGAVLQYTECKPEY